MNNIIPVVRSFKELGGKRKFEKKDITYVTDESYLEETYTIEITQNSFTVTAKTARGFFNAEKTLEFLVDENGFVPCVKVHDFPRFSYRAFMIDSSRHMQSIDELKTFIEAASRLKFNYFHWHLSDDQGYRIESEVFPALNEVGSWRKCEGFAKDENEPYGGFYTKKQIAEIVEFCRQRYIEIVPEIDLPGHTTAMLASFPNLSCTGKNIEVKTVHGIFKDILCAGNEDVYDFCFKLLDEVTELFPCKYFHIGGDEAPKARWKKCEKCQAAIKRENLQNEEQLQGYFTKRICTYLKEKGKIPVCWNESLNSGMIEKDVVISDWFDIKHKSEEFANGGGKIIVENLSYYLDYPYGKTPLKKTYNFNPVLNRLNENGRKNILGVEAPLWTEFIDTFDRLCYLAFPRLSAVAETGWSDEENRSYKSFLKRAKNFEKTLLTLGIKQANEQKWNPAGINKLKDMARLYYKKLTPKTIRWLMKPEEFDMEDANG